MKKVFCCTLLVLILTISPFLAAASIIDFEDLEVTNYSALPPDYAGFTWRNLSAHAQTNEGAFENSGYSRIGGEVGIFNNFGARAAISRETEFNFIGGDFMAAWNEGLNISIQGSKGGEVLYQDVISVSPFASETFLFNYLGIDMLSFISYGGEGMFRYGAGTHFVADNLNFGAAPVPEPTTMLLFGTGLIGLVVASRTKKRKK